MSGPRPLLHPWHLEERELRRHLDRRGRTHAYDSLDPARTALVVVDLVSFFVDGSAHCRGIVPQVNRLAGALRAAGGTVAWVVPATGEPTPWARGFYGDRVAELYAGSGGLGGVRDRLWPGLEVDGADVLAEKSSWGAFFPGCSDLPAQLEARGVDTVVVCGTVTNVCVEATVREAATLGHRCLLVADASAAVRDEDHHAALHVVHRSFGDVRSTDEVLALLQPEAAAPRATVGPTAPVALA